jgi:beta-N-acetylglucosaminidase
VKVVESNYWRRHMEKDEKLTDEENPNSVAQNEFDPFLFVEIKGMSDPLTKEEIDELLKDIK